MGILFLWAAVSKLANPSQFLGTLYAYELPIPRGLLMLTAVVLPWVELLTGLLLLGRIWTECALTLAAGLLLLFLATTAQAWIRGLQISCGCLNLGILGLGAEDSRVAAFLESPAFAVARNLFIAGVVGYLICYHILHQARRGD